MTREKEKIIHTKSFAKQGCTPGMTFQTNVNINRDDHDFCYMDHDSVPHYKDV